MTATDRADLAAIRRALLCLPKLCRYHGDQTDPPPSLVRRAACCDTGEPAQARKTALAALDRLTARAEA